MKMTSQRAILAAAAAILVAGGICWQFFRSRMPSVAPPNYDHNLAIIEREKAAGREVRTIDIRDIDFDKEGPTEITTLSITARRGEKVKFRIHSSDGRYPTAFVIGATKLQPNGKPITSTSSSGRSFRDETSGDIIHEAVLDFPEEPLGTFDIQFDVVGYPEITFKDALKVTPADKSPDDPPAEK